MLRFAMDISVIIVEDDKESRELICKYISDIFYKIYKTKSAEDAMPIIESDNNLQLILLDWNLPGITGVEFSKIIRESVKDRYIYIFMITGEKSNDSIIMAYENGVDNYITKPFSFQELKAKLISAKRVIAMENNLRKRYLEVKEKSIYDQLTGLFNRSEIFEKLNIELIKHRRLNIPLSIVLFDIDFFKKINDSYGHQCGDYVLKTVAEIMKNNVRLYDYIGRYGGEEFLLICPKTDRKETFNIAQRINNAVSNMDIKYNDLILNVTLSGGVSDTIETKKLEDLIELADKRLYISKMSGKNKITY
ncbi:MAG: diguanylate cyclase [Calditerrivibrio sp.]|nr:diguanylate cyclase [Calditerrivibrio sp.]